jgi:hypothetical protein
LRAFHTTVYRMSHCMILGQLLNLISPTKINISELRLEF